MWSCVAAAARDARLPRVVTTANWWGDSSCHGLALGRDVCSRPKTDSPDGQRLSLAQCKSQESDFNFCHPYEAGLHHLFMPLNPHSGHQIGGTWGQNAHSETLQNPSQQDNKIKTNVSHNGIRGRLSLANLGNINIHGLTDVLAVSEPVKQTMTWEYEVYPQPRWKQQSSRRMLSLLLERSWKQLSLLQEL